MRRFITAVFRFIPHAIIVLSLMMITFYITDRYNRAMAFINNDITKALILVLAVLAIAESVYVIYIYRRQQWEEYNKSKDDENK